MRSLSSGERIARALAALRMDHEALIAFCEEPSKCCLKRDSLLLPRCGLSVCYLLRPQWASESVQRLFVSRVAIEPSAFMT